MWHANPEVVPGLTGALGLKKGPDEIVNSPRKNQPPSSSKDRTPRNKAHPSQTAIYQVTRKPHPLSALGLWFRVFNGIIPLKSLAT